jgi:hypothetical protein
VGATIELTTGAFLGIWNGRNLVVGSLCDISLHNADGGVPLQISDSPASMPASRADAASCRQRRQSAEPGPYPA